MLVKNSRLVLMASSVVVGNKLDLQPWALIEERCNMTERWRLWNDHVKDELQANGQMASHQTDRSTHVRSWVTSVHQKFISGYCSISSAPKPTHFNIASVVSTHRRWEDRGETRASQHLWCLAAAAWAFAQSQRNSNHAAWAQYMDIKLLW